MEVPRSIPEVTTTENTSSKRVPAATAIASPVVMPELVVPTPTTPVRTGARVTTAPGIAVNVLSGVVDSYSSAVIVTVDPTRARAALVLAKALIEVIVPSLGMENAICATLVVSIAPAAG